MVAEINKNLRMEIEDWVSHHDDSEFRKQRVNIVQDKKNSSIRIPKLMMGELNIDAKTDVFEFKIIIDPENRDKRELHAVWVKNGRTETT